MYQQGEHALTYPVLNYSVNFPVGFPTAPTLVNVDVRFSGAEEDQIPVSVIVNNITDTYFDFSLSNPIADVGSYATPAEAYMSGSGFIASDAFSIGSEFYTLVTSVSGPFDILVGASDAETRENIVDAINANSTIVTAELLDSGTYVAFAKIVHVTPGVVGNSVALPNMGPPAFSDSFGDPVTTMFGGSEDTPSGYTVMWQANDGVSTAVPAGPGYPVSNFPPFNKPNLPDSTVFPIVINVAGLRSYSLTWARLKSLLSSAHSHLISQISDITTIGSRLLRSTTSAEARAAIDASVSGHSHIADNISDATTVGKEVLTADTQAAARLAIGSAATVHTHVTTDISDSTALGRNILKSSSKASARALIDSPATTHTHAVADISDSTVVGRDIVKASSPANARETIAAMSSNGWNGLVSITSSSSLDQDVYGKIVNFSTTGVTFTIPSGISTIFRTGIFIPSGVAITLALGSGSVNLLSEDLVSLGSTVPLFSGSYVLECTGLNQFVLSRYKNTFQKALATAVDQDAFKTNLDLNITDLMDLAPLVKSSLGGSTEEMSKPKINIKTPTYVSLGAVSLSSFFTDTAAGRLFILNQESNLTIDSLGSAFLDGESFEIQNLMGFHNSIYIPDGITVNGVTDTVIPIKFGEIISFTKLSGVSGTEALASSISLAQPADHACSYVSTNGNDATAITGDINRPWFTIQAAVAAAEDNQTIIVFPGEYVVPSGAHISATNKVGVTLFFYPGVTVINRGAKSLFQDFEGPIDMTVRGYAKFRYHHTGGNEGLVYLTNADSLLDLEFESNTRGVSGSVSNYPPIRVTGVLNPVRVKANTFNNLVGNQQLVVVDASTVNIEFQKADCGVTGFSILNGGTINATVSNGYLNIGESLFTSSSSTDQNVLKLNLINSDLVQTNSSDVFIALNDAYVTVTIAGINSTIYSLEAETDGLVLTTAGTLILKGVTLRGTIGMANDNLFLDGVNIHIDYTYNSTCIYSASPEERNVVVYRTCISNAPPALDMINLTGGNFIWNEDFSQY